MSEWISDFFDLIQQTLKENDNKQLRLDNYEISKLARRIKDQFKKGETLKKQKIIINQSIQILNQNIQYTILKLFDADRILTIKQLHGLIFTKLPYILGLCQAFFLHFKMNQYITGLIQMELNEIDAHLFIQFFEEERKKIKQNNNELKNREIYDILHFLQYSQCQCYYVRLEDDSLKYIQLEDGDNTIQQKNEQFYHQIFKNQFIQEFEQFYQQTKNQLKEQSVENYFEEIKKYFMHEQNIGRHYYPKFYRETLSIFLNIMVEQEISLFTYNPYWGISKSFTSQNYSDQKEIFQFTKQIEIFQDTIKLSNIINQILKHFKMSVINDAKEIDSDQSNQFFMLDSLLKIKQKYYDIIGSIFQSDQRFFVAFKQAMETIVNQYQDQISFLIAKKLFTLSVKDEKIKEYIELIQYLWTKDNFIKHYQQFLMRKLISQVNTINDDKYLADQIKQYYPNLDIIEKMIQDTSYSVELNQEFINKNQKYPFDFQIIIGTYGYWPFNELNNYEDFHHHQNIKSLYSNFETFYIERFQQRKLYWSQKSCFAEVILKLNDHRFELKMTGQQFLIFYNFNKKDEISLDEIAILCNNQKQGTNSSILFTYIDLLSILSPLFNEKILILSDKMTVRINLKFYCKKKMIKLNRVPFQVDNKIVPNDQLKDVCNYKIDSEIVKILKQEKQLSYQQLLQKCNQYLTQDQKLFKSRIEYLINLDYIKRNEADMQEQLKYIIIRNQYQYI